MSITRQTTRRYDYLDERRSSRAGWLLAVAQQVSPLVALSKSPWFNLTAGLASILGLLVAFAQLRKPRQPPSP